MSRARRALSARSCAVGRGERGIRAVIAVFLAAVALDNLDNLWCAIPAGVCATFLAIGAITGWCPTDRLARTPSETGTNALGHAEARQQLVP